MINNAIFRAMFCGVAMMMLAVASIVCVTWVELPTEGDYDRLFLSKPDRLVWFDTRRFEPEKFKIPVLDLQTHKVHKCSVRQIQAEFNVTADGNYVRLPLIGMIQTLMNMNRETGKPIRETRLPVRFPGELISQRFLVSQESGTMFVCDVLSEDPAKLRSLPLTDWHPLAETEFFVIEGTELVTEISKKAVAPPPASAAVLPARPRLQYAINVYRIELDKIRMVASWTAGECRGPVNRYGDTLLSVSPDGQKLEARDVNNLAVVKSKELPQELIDALPSSTFYHELCQFYDPTSRSRKLYRLDTMEQLQKVDGLSIEYRTVEFIRPTSRYRILRGADSGFQSMSMTHRLAVYDLSQNTMVFDRRFPGFPAAEVLDGDRLALAHPYCGLTLEIYDLKTGRRLEYLSLFAWVLPWLAMWSLAVAIVAFVWVYYSARAGVSLFTSVLWLAICFVPIQIYPLTIYGSAITYGRLPVSYAIATLLVSAPAGLVWIGFSGLQNRMMRCAYQLLVLSLIVMALVTLGLQDSFPNQAMIAGALIIAAVVMVISWLGLMALRLRGYRAHWPGRPAYERSNTTLLHFFALSGVSALFVVSLAPLRVIPMAMIDDYVRAILSALVVAFPCLFIFLLLKMSDQWFARWRLMAMLAALLLVLDSIGAFVYPHQFIMTFYAPYMRVFLANLVFTFLWLWAFRLRGCRLLRG